MRLEYEMVIAEMPKCFLPGCRNGYKPYKLMRLEYHLKVAEMPIAEMDFEGSKIPRGSPCIFFAMVIFGNFPGFIN